MMMKVALVVGSAMRLGWALEERVVDGIGLSTAGVSALRIRFAAAVHPPIETLMVSGGKDADAAWEAASDPVYGSGIRSAIGSAFVDKGTVTVLDGEGAVKTRTQSDEECGYWYGADVETCERSGAPLVVGSASECCTACGDGCATWIYAPTNESVDGSNCWTCSSTRGRISRSDRVLGGQQNGTVSFTVDATRRVLLGGAAMGDESALDFTARPGVAYASKVYNTAVFAPYYWSERGYGVLGVVRETTGIDSTNELALSYALTTNGTVQWQFPAGAAFEAFLMPSASTYDAATDAYAQLIGTVPVPPLYTMGFIASRWGWNDTDYARDVLRQFRDGGFPIDAIVMDFEWFTNVSDYTFTSTGESWYHDFGFNNATWTSGEPAQEIASFRHDFDVRFGGIRKPRLGNSDLILEAAANGWLLPGGEEAYANGRCLNYSNPDARDWYADKQTHYLSQGVSFWWNDEGETDYFTFHLWNLAHLQYADPDQRFFSLNRAWTPGTAGLGAAAWTGDINPTWDALRQTPGTALAWGLGGLSTVACDIGGFTAETNALLLTRWYFLGVFMGLMRVHSTLDATPHFPFLWPEPYASAMRAALELRYRLIPYHYSLFHTQFRSGRLPLRPVLAQYPDYPVKTDVFLDGDLLVAPVLDRDGSLNLVLPNASLAWFDFNATTLRAPNSAYAASNVSLDASFAAFVPAGTVLVFAPLAQSTDDLLDLVAGGAALQVQIYDGADATFLLYEDDGLSRAYETGADLRVIALSWNTTARVLTLNVLNDTTSSSFPLYQSFTAELLPYGSNNRTTLGPFPVADGARVAF